MGASGSLRLPDLRLPDSTQVSGQACTLKVYKSTQQPAIPLSRHRSSISSLENYSTSEYPQPHDPSKAQ